MSIDKISSSSLQAIIEFQFGKLKQWINFDLYRIRTLPGIEGESLGTTAEPLGQRARCPDGLDVVPTIIYV